ncbi:MAG TPA: nucleoside hydrolase, partial [Candidatus Korarchaeota archaeon]|nr:nucleoside hydrolase [Candidatus Korarchaeota archaeon]
MVQDVLGHADPVPHVGHEGREVRVHLQLGEEPEGYPNRVNSSEERDLFPRQREESTPTLVLTHLATGLARSGALDIPFSEGLDAGIISDRRRACAGGILPRKVILDVDTGVDDAAAIMLALKSPELEVLGITTVAGNVDVEKATRNTLYVLEVLGRSDVPVAPGAPKPITPGGWSIGERIHGAGGLGGVEVPEPAVKPSPTHAVDFIREVVRSEGPGSVTLITTAPMTNVALALLIEPDLAERLRAIISMGGAFCTSRLGTGNSAPRGEFNVWFDPLAAKIVYNSGAEVYA